MNRSIRLLRPLGSTALTSGQSALRPTSLVLRQGRRQPTSAFPLAAQSPLSLAFAVASRARGYASNEKDKLPNPTLDKEHKGSHANPRADNQSAAKSASEEIKGATRDLASMIRGSGHYPPSTLASETSAHGHSGSITEDFHSITRGMFSAVPRDALYFGAAGLLPYLGTSVATIVLAREASRAANGVAHTNLADALSLLHTVESVQITYGAIILSFLGAIHWGMEFSKLGGEFGWKRLAIGTLPVLFAWPTTFLPHGVALATQWAGFTTMWFIDHRVTSNGWTTSWYSTYRFYLSIVVGFSIIATLWGTGYYGAGAGAITSTDVKHTQHTTERVSPMKRLDRIKEKENPKFSGKQSGTIGGDMQVDEREDGEGYLKLRNIAKEKEEEEEEQEEQKKKEEENEKQKQEKAELQDKKDEGQQNQAPGRMKDTAPDRTGKNKNVEGGEEWKEGEEKTKGLADGVKRKKLEEGASDVNEGKAVGDDARGAEGSHEEKKNSGEKGKGGEEAQKEANDQKDQVKEDKDKKGGEDQKEQKGSDNKKDGDGKGEAAGKKGAAGEGNTGMK